MWRLFLFIAILLCSNEKILADRAGIVGRTISGCSCHSVDPNAEAIVSHNLTSNSITVASGETISITAYVAHASLPSAGINISVKDTNNNNIGTFTAGAGLRLLNGELTHSSPQSISGSPRRAQFLFQWTAPTTPGTYSLRMAGLASDNNLSATGDCWNFLSVPLTIIVPGIETVSPNGNEQWCRGSSQAIKWKSVGVSQVSIELSSNSGQQWSIINGSVSAASGQYIWNIPSQIQPGGAYLIRISDASNRIVNDASNSPFYISAIPIITKQPDSSIVACEGSKVRFSVEVEDNPAYFTFQWRRNGQAINNAQSYSYETPPIVAGVHDGLYDVVISGCGSNVTSSISKLVIKNPPKITMQPQNVYVCPGESAALSFAASGAISKYEWRKNGKLLANSNISKITFNSVSAKDTGVYEASAIGLCAPSAVSNTVVLGFLPAPRLSIALHDTSACENQPLILTVKTIDSATAYTWRKGADVIYDITGDSLLIPSVNYSSVGKYSVTLKNRCGFASVSEANITFIQSPVILKQTADTAVPASEQLTLSVLAKGDNLRYQWKKNNKVLLNDTLPIVIIQSVFPQDTGKYDCIISNECGEAVASIKVGLNGSSGPLLTFENNLYDFGCVRPGQFRDFLFPNLIRNDGGALLTITATEIVGAEKADFSIIEGGGSYQLATGKTQNLKIRFSPSSPGPKQSQILFHSNSTSGFVKTLNISGRGCETCISLQRIVFDSIAIGEFRDSVISVCNSCSIPFIAQRLDTLTDGQFLLVEHEQTPKTLQTGACLSMTVRYAPTTNGPASGIVRLVSGAEAHLIEFASLRSLLTNVQSSEDNADFSIWPNPMNTLLTINANKANSIKITDIFGRDIIRFYQSDIQNGTVVWNRCIADGTHCSAGTYLIIISNGTSIRTMPFIISQ